MRLHLAATLSLIGAILATESPARGQTSPSLLPQARQLLNEAPDFQRPGSLLTGLDLLNEVARPPFVEGLLGKDLLEKVRILDVRPRAEYDAGHIPRAVWVDARAAQTLASRPGGLTDGDAWSEWSRPLGLPPDMGAIIIDGDRQLDAARIWWLLRYIGMPNVSLANGNFELWRIQRRPVTQEIPDVRPNPFPVNFQSDRLATRADVLTSLQGKNARIVDARSAAEWTGQELRARRGGHIPNACRLEWLDFVDKYGRFLSAESIKAKIAAAGIIPGEAVITHCQGGGRAAVDAYVFEALGYPTRNYYLSWADWGNADETPITNAETSPTLLAAVAADATAAVVPQPAEPVQAAAAAVPVAEATQAPAPGAPAAKPFTAEYYYKCHWGRSDEFLALFQKNHLPILRERIKQGGIVRVSMTKPRIHENEFGRWDYRVTIEFRDAAAAFDPAADQAIKERLFPDQAAYRLEEQRRFELLDAHWDLPIDDVDLDKPVMVP